MRMVIFALLALLTVPRTATADGPRPTVGAAFGGGSARGIAHAGVIRWFEEHRIPIDMAAGTSMGGLIGGAFATGMDAAELADMLKHMNWDEMFGGSSFASRGVIMDTLIGPVIVAGSAGFDGRWRTYLGVGRIFGGRR